MRHPSPHPEFTRTDADAMRAWVDALADARAALSESLEALTAQLHPERDHWDAAVREAYDEAQAQWDASTARMRAIIGELGALANEATRGRA